ncbi:MAG: redoxin family protein [Oligoflexia bacterium]|nr:redoxin family protein [Oligoflexia bacterium]
MKAFFYQQEKNFNITVIKDRVLWFIVIWTIFVFFSSCSFIRSPYLLTGIQFNKAIRDLSLFPINSSRFRLSELEDKKAIVFFMREKDCPISEKYGPRIARLEKRYSKKGIQFIYNYVGQFRAKESAEEDLKKFGFQGPYLIDSKQTVMDALSAETTGDVFILTPERRVVYRGPLDDQFHLLKSALRAKNNYVSDILDAIISGKKVVPKELPLLAV